MLWLEADTEKSLRIEAIKRKSDFMMKNPSINGKIYFIYKIHLIMPQYKRNKNDLF